MTEVVLAACADEQGILATDLRSSATVASFEEGGAPQPHAFGCVGVSSSHIYAVQAKKALWQVWAWGDKRPSYRASLPEKLTAMTFSDDASFCFGGAASGSVYVWLTSTGSLLRCWPAHFRDVTQLLISADGGFLVSASADASVHVYNLADVLSEGGAPKPFHSWSGHALAVTSLALLPGSTALQQVVASASLDRSVRLWDVGTGQPLLSRSMAAPVHGLSAGPAGGELLVACGNGDLKTLSTSSSSGEGGLYLGHTGAVLGCAMSADGSRAVSCSDVDRVRIWETRTRQCVAQVHAGRNVQVSGVKIVRRARHVPAPPPFQPFQRLLTAPEEVPPVTVCTAGREGALKAAMAQHTKAQCTLEGVQWATASQASSGQTMAASGQTGAASEQNSQDLAEQLSQARASEARWAKLAAQLYGVIANAGLDASGSVSSAPNASIVPGESSSDTGAVQAAAAAEPSQAGSGKKVLTGSRKKKRQHK